MARPKAFDPEIVLDRAVNLFWKQGYHATSMQDVVDALGINRASIYQTFGDKHALFLQALMRYQETNEAGIHGLEYQPGQLKPLVEGFLEASIQSLLSDSDQKGCFMVNCATEMYRESAEAMVVITQNLMAFEAFFEEVFCQAQHHGELKEGHHPLQLARFLFNTLNGMNVLFKTDPDEGRLRDIAQVAIQAIC